MRNFGLAMTFGLAAMLMLSACHPRHHHPRHEPEQRKTIPAGGTDFGTLDHFHQAYAERTISGGSDLDGFEFSLARSSVVLITFTGTGSLDGFLDLYDSGFNFLGGDDNGGPGPDPVIVAILDQGDYFFVAGSADGTVGAYAVDISVEPRGGADLGVMFVPDSIIDTGGSISDAFDVDSYIFTVYDNCFADIFITRTSGNFDGNLQLMDEYGNELAYIDPIGNDDPFLLNQALTPGTYIIRIGANSGGGDYDIQLDTF